MEVGKASLKAPNGTELLIEGVKTDSQRAMEVAEFAAKAATVLAQQAREDRITAEAKAEAADLFDDENTESEPVEGDK